MLFVGLLVTMGIGSSFSTLPIIAAIYVPLCVSLGFSPLATVSIIGTAGAGRRRIASVGLDAWPHRGSQCRRSARSHDDTVIPTFIHFNSFRYWLLVGWQP